MSAKKIIPGGLMKRPAPPPSPPGIIPGGTRKAGPPGARINPGGGIKVAPHAGHAKKAQPGPKRPWTTAKKHRAKKAGLSLGEVQCCAARAVAASLGCPVSDEAILALYWHTAWSADAGAFIEATLEAAGEHGLGGIRLAGFGEADDSDGGAVLGLDMPGGVHAVYDDGERWWSWGEPYDPADFAGAAVSEAWAVSW